MKEERGVCLEREGGKANRPTEEWLELFSWFQPRSRIKGAFDVSTERDD